VHLYKTLADRQPQPAAAVLAPDRVVELLERLEQPRMVFAGDARPAVLNRDRQLPVRAPRPHLHPALVGKPSGIAQQIDDHLADARLVAVHLAHPRLDVGMKIEALAGEQGLDHIEGFIDDHFHPARAACN